MSGSVRIGILGVGNMGLSHARSLLAGKVPRLELTAVADTRPERLALVPQVKGYRRAADLVASGLVDAVLIATPHYDHVPAGISALRAGLHVMLEKPVAVHKADAERLLAAHRGRETRQVFAAMFNQRTDPFYRKIRDLVHRGELGEVRRVAWTVTDWFRTDAYYASGDWRATWAGEGGGVLLNQAPHNLDLLQWIFGSPAEVFARCSFGRHHAIEVEDEVTALLRFPNGADGVFTTSTGEAPGTNRLEVAGDRGKLVCEDDRLLFWRNETPARDFSRTSPDPFARPPVWHVTLPVTGRGGQHNEVLKNFADAILDGTPLIAPAAEGLPSLELANAMLLSAWTGKNVALPIDGRAYARRLRALAATSPLPRPA